MLRGVWRAIQEVFPPSGRALCAALIAAAVLATPALGQEFIELGVLDPYDVAVNGSVVVGEAGVRDSRTGGIVDRAFRWTRDAGMVSLGTLGRSSRAKAVSSDGSVVAGEFYDENSFAHVFRWTEESGMVDIGTLGGSTSQFFALSADGSTIVGRSLEGPHEFDYPSDYVYYNNHAFVWTEATGMVDLGVLGNAGSETSSSAATDVSADGSVVVGISETNQDTAHAFRWTKDTGMVDLGVPTSISVVAPVRVSADGSTVVGTTQFIASGNLHRNAFRWKDGTVTDIGAQLRALGGNRGDSGATAVSADGSVVVGWVSLGQGSHAWVWKDGAVTDIGASAGDYSTSPSGVSADGSVVVGTASQSTSDLFGWRWTSETGLQSIEDWLSGLGVVIDESVEIRTARAISDDGSAIVGQMKDADGHQAYLALGLAGEARWDGSKSQDWHTAENWETGRVPTDSDVVVIDAGASHPAVLFGQAGEAQTLTVGNEESGKLTVTDGSVLTTGQGVLGGQAGGFGEVEVIGVGTRWANSGALYVGNRGTGFLFIINAATVETTSATVALEEGSGGGIGVYEGASLVVQNALTLGERDLGTLAVQSGGLVTAYAVTMGAEAAGTGQAAIAGPDSSLVITDLMEIGLQGSGTLTVETGAEVGTGGSAYLGVLPDSDGEATVTGSGSLWEIQGDLFVGKDGSGQLVVEGGGIVESARGQIGVGAEGFGGAVVEGAGSQWILSKDLVAGLAGVGTLDVASGGTVTSAEVVTVGNDAGAAGSVTVRGPGSTLGVFQGFGVGIAGEGTLTISEDGSVEVYDGPVVIAEYVGSVGTVEIGGGSAPGRLEAPEVRFGQGAGVLRFDHTGTHVLEADVSGAGTIVQRSGTTVLNGDLSGFTGVTGIYDGTLIVNGNLGGSLVVEGGQIGGTGSLPPVTIPAGAAASPGNSIGTLTTQGVTFEPGSLYEVEVNGAGASDLIHATGTPGTAELNGGTVVVTPLSGVVVGSPYTILTADGGVTGEFDEATFSYDPAFIAAGLSDDANHVYLTITQTASFDSVAKTENQEATARAVESTGQGHGVWDAVIVLEADEARSAFDQLSGEIHASVKAGLLDEVRLVGEVAASRVRTGFPRQRPQARGFWGYAVSDQGTWPGDGNAAPFRRSLRGLLGGWQGAAGESWRLGVTLGKTWADFAAGERGSEGTSETVHLTANAFSRWGPVALQASASYASHTLATQRSLAFSGFSDKPSARYGARTVQLVGTIAYPTGGTYALESFLSLAWARLETDRFAEDGGDAALTVASSVARTAEAAVGLRSHTAFALGGLQGTAHGALGWRQGFGVGSPASSARFSEGSAFTVKGVLGAPSGTVLQAGVELELARAISLRMGYTGTLTPTGEQKADVAFAFSF